MGVVNCDNKPDWPFFFLGDEILGHFVERFVLNFKRVLGVRGITMVSPEYHSGPFFVKLALNSAGLSNNTRY